MSRTETYERTPRGFVPSRDHLHNLVNREAPVASHAERGLLSCLMIDRRCYPSVAEIIDGPDAFNHAGYAILYAEISSLIDGGSVVDIPTLCDRLKLKGVLDGMGGEAGLIDIVETESKVSIPTAVERAKAIAEAHGRRKLADLGGNLIHNAHESRESLADIIDRASREVLELGRIGERQTAKTGVATASQLMQLTYDELMAAEGAPQGTSTGFTPYDEITSGGLHDGELTIIAGRPSMGKSALASNMAQNMALIDGVPVGLFSLEMNKRELAWRMMAGEANVPLQNIRRNTLAGLEVERLGIAASNLSSAPLYIDDTPGLSLMGLRNRARRMVAEWGVRALFVDYLQLMRDPGAENRLQEVSSISRGLKQLARELALPVVCLSQLNRAPEQRDGHRPRLSDLRESGSIEQDADVVGFVYRQDYYSRHDPSYEPDYMAEVIIAKQRNGPTDTVRLAWNRATTTFREP